MSSVISSSRRSGWCSPQFGHDLAQPLRTDRRRHLHRMNNIGEQHSHLLVLRRLGGPRESRTAFGTELGRRAGLRTTGTTEQRRRGQSTATIPAGVHVSIVSLLLRGRSQYHPGDPLRGAAAAPFIGRWCRARHLMWSLMPTLDADVRLVADFVRRLRVGSYG